MSTTKALLVGRGRHDYYYFKVLDSGNIMLYSNDVTEQSLYYSITNFLERFAGLNWETV